MIGRRRREIVSELKILNANLSLIAEILQKPESGFKGDGWYLRQIEKAIREHPTPDVKIGLGNAEQPLADISELLARWLWLQLPEESKKDLMP